MKKTQIRPIKALSLNRETLCALEEPALEAVIGGITGASMCPKTSHACCPTN